VCVQPPAESHACVSTTAMHAPPLHQQVKKEDEALNVAWGTGPAFNLPQRGPQMAEGGKEVSAADTVCLNMRGVRAGLGVLVCVAHAAAAATQRLVGWGAAPPAARAAAAHRELAALHTPQELIRLSPLCCHCCWRLVVFRSR
jgi:hypothetical protein